MNKGKPPSGAADCITHNTTQSSSNAAHTNPERPKPYPKRHKACVSQPPAATREGVTPAGLQHTLARQRCTQPVGCLNPETYHWHFQPVAAAAAAIQWVHTRHCHVSSITQQLNQPGVAVCRLACMAPLACLPGSGCMLLHPVLQCPRPQPLTPHSTTLSAQLRPLKSSTACAQTASGCSSCGRSRTSRHASRQADRTAMPKLAVHSSHGASGLAEAKPSPGVLKRRTCTHKDIRTWARGTHTQMRVRATHTHVQAAQDILTGHPRTKYIRGWCPRRCTPTEKRERETLPSMYTPH